MELFNEQTLLQCAVVQRDKKLIEELMSNDYDIDNKYYCMEICGEFISGIAPIHAAVALGSREMVEFLLKKGANINLKSGQELHEEYILLHARKLAPIHIAVKKNNIQMINLLSENGADLDIRDEQDESPLDMAVDHTLIAATLIANGADIASGDIPLMFRSIARKNFELVCILSQIHDPNLMFKGKTALEFAMENFPETVECLIMNNCFIRGRKNHEIFKTPLHRAIEMRNENWINLLIKKKFDVNVPDKDQNYPLHYAVYYKSSRKTMLYLLSAGAEPSLRNRFKLTPLIYAIEDNLIELIDLLLQFETKLSTENLELQKAIDWHHTDAILLLLDYINSSIKTCKIGSTPLIWYFLDSWDHPDVDFNDLLKIFNKMIELGCPLNETNPWYGSLLHYLILSYSESKPIKQENNKILFLNLLSCKQLNFNLIFKPKLGTLNDGRKVCHEDVVAFGSPLEFSLSFKNTGYFAFSLVISGADLNNINWKNVYFSKEKVMALKAMYYVGFRFGRSQLDAMNNSLMIQHVDDSVEKEVNQFEFESFIKWLKDHQCNPMSLKNLARLNMIKFWQRDIDHFIESNCMPNELKEFLKFKNWNPTC